MSFHVAGFFQHKYRIQPIERAYLESSAGLYTD